MSNETDRACRAATIIFLLMVLGTPAVSQEPPLQRTARIEEPGSLGVGKLVADLELTPLRGEMRRLSAMLKDRKGLVLVMTSVDCPLCMKYSARIAAMEDEFGKRGITFVYVNTVDADTNDEMLRQVRKFGFDGPYLADRTRTIPRALGARTTTEVFLIDAARTLVYRGAVDDQFGVGAALDAPRQHFLRDALESLLTLGRVRVGATWSPGCLIDVPRTSAPVTDDLTYYGRIARIFADNCVSCHRPGGPAPFELDSIAAVRGRAKMIDAVVNDRLMPPWHGAVSPEGRSTVWVNDRSVAQADKDDLLKWLRAGLIEGDPKDAPVPTSQSRTWNIGEPDLILTTPGFRLPAEGGLRYGRQVVSLAFTEDRWISALEVRPVESESVHHALIWILHPGGVLPESGAVPTGLELFATYSPGDNIIRYPAGVAKRVRAGSLLIADVYSRPMGKEALTTLRIGMRLVEEPKWNVRSLTVSTSSLDIAPGVPRVEASASLAIPDHAPILAITPSMRSRGREVSIDSIHRDGSVSTILAAPNYDFRWQIRYEFIEPLSLPTGTRLSVRGVFDNSAANPNNPSPGSTVRAGSGPETDALVLSVEILEPVGERPPALAKPATAP